jgi:hypothetical protein
MSDELIAGRGDGAALPVGLISGEGMQIEADAVRLLDVLNAVAGSKLPQARQAQKHADRLTFGVQRLGELRSAATRTGGVFAPARAEVAASILEGYVAGAAGFINRTMRQVRRAPGRRELRAEVDEAAAALDSGALDEGFGEETKAA